MPIDPTTEAKLDDLLAAIRKYPDPRQASTAWRQVYKLLQKTPLPPGRVTAVVGMRDVAGLATFLEQLRLAGTAEEPPPPDEDTWRKALAAFRKRLEVTILDEESKLGRGPLSKGAHEGPAAVVPPTDWPQEVWDYLVRLGKIKPIGHGLYELGKP